MTNYIKKLLALAVAAGAMTAMDARAASGAMDYSRWSQNPYVATWKGTANNLTSAGTSLYSQFDISDPLNPIDSEVTWGNGNNNVEIPGYGNYWAWSIYCISATTAEANHYQAPGNVLRFAPGAGTPGALGAALSELAFGGLIVEEGATGYSLVQTGNNRATGLGNNSTAEGIKEKEDWFDIRENFSFNRSGTFTLYGILNIDIAAGRIFDLNSAQSATAANHPKLHTGTNAHLKMHGEGTLKVPTLTATGSVTLDFSDLASRANTEPFIDGNLTVNGSTSIVFPAEWAENEPYKLCSGALTAPDKSGRMIVRVGEEEITGVLTYDTANATVSYAEDRSSSEPLLVNFMKGAPLTPTAGWLDWGVTANSSTLQGSAAYIGGERTAHLTSTANGNFIGANTDEVANDFTAGNYSDVYGRIHSSLVEEVKASLDLDETTIFDETVYKTGLMNGGYSSHMATIANLVPGHRYVIYIGTGRLNTGNNAQTSGLMVPTGGYTSLGAIEYVVTAASANNPVATAYTKANPGDEMEPGVNGLLLVRISNVMPTESGEFKFQLKGQRAGINFLAVKELNLEEAELSANLDSLAPLQKSKLRGGLAPALVETGTAPTLTPVRGSATNKATKFPAGGFYTIDSSTVCAEDFSLLAVAKLSEATAAPKVIMSIGNASWDGGSKGLTLVLDGNIVKLVNWSHPTQNAVIALEDSAVLLEKEVLTASTQFHSYFVTYDNANSKVKLFVDGVAVSEEGVSAVVNPSRERLELARIFGGAQYFKFGSEGAPFTGGADFEFDEIAVWSSDMSLKARWIAEDYPLWPNMIDYTASGDIALSQIEAELGEDVSVNLTMPAGSTLTIDKAIGERLRLNSTGELTVKGGETHALSAQDVNLIEKGEQGTVKYLFTADSVTTDLVAPASGITYRFDGLTDVAAPLFGNTAFDGTVEYVNTTFAGIAIPGHATNDGHQRYVFGEGCSATAERWVLSNQSQWASGRRTYLDVVQTGGTITLTKEYDQDSATMDDTANSTLVLAHYNSAMTYALTGGVLDASAGTVGFGRDGGILMTVGGGEGAATFKALGISKNNRAWESSLTVTTNGVVELGKWGVNFAGNKTLLLAGGTLRMIDDNKLVSSVTPITIVDDTVSTIEVADGKTTIIEAAITGTGTILKTGEGLLDVKSSRPIVDVRAGKIRLTASDAEIIAGKIELTVPAGASAASTDKVIVVDAKGETIKIAGATISGTKLTLTLDAIQITEATAISSLNLADDATSPVAILGGASAAEAYDVTFDKALPSGVMLFVSGHVNFVGSGVTTFPATQIELSENASLQIDKPFDSEFTIKAHTTLAIDGEVNSTHRILVESFYSTLKVNSGATLSFDLEEAGNPIQNTSLTDLRTNGTFELYGTLDFGANDWSHNFYGIYGDDTNDMHCAISLYAGSKITGTGTMTRQGGEIARYQLKQGEGEEKYATIDIKMSTGYAGIDTIFDFEEGAGLKISKVNSREAEHNKLRGTIGYFEALDGETYTLKHEEDLVSKIDGIVYVNEGDTLKLEGLTDASAIVKQGAGVLDIGTQAVAVKIEAGKVKVLATTDNLAGKLIVLPLPSGVTAVDKANYTVVDIQGNEVEIDTAAIVVGKITLTLDSLPLINASTSISALNLSETASGLLIIEGGNSAEKAITLTFDQALPEGVMISMKGFIRLVTATGVEIPYAKMTFEEGCTLMFDAIDGYTIPEGAIVIAGTASGNIVNNGTLTITGGGNFKLTNAANKTVRFTGGTSTVTADNQCLKGVIEIARGATFVNGSTDAMWYGGAVTVKVWGTLDMAATRWSMGANSKVIAYDGAVITGAGQGNNGAFDTIAADLTYLLISNEGLAEGATGTVTNSAPTRVRTACKVEVAENMTLVNNGRFINNGGNALNKTGAGKLVQSANLETTGAITVEAGTLELNASAGGTVSVASNITGAGNLVLSGEGTVKVRGIELTGTKTYTAAKILLNGTTIDYNVAVKTANLTTHYIAESGTNTVKWVGGVNDGNAPICDNDSKDDPFIKVNAGATVNIFGHDYSGWKGELRDTGWLVNNGTLVFQNEAGTRFFREHLVMGNGSVTKIDQGATPLLLYGGAGAVDGCQLMLPSGTATISAGAAGANAALHLGNSSGGAYGTKGAGISVGEGATLTISLPVKGKAEDPITKWGEGTLVFTGSFEGYNATEGLILNGGTLKLAPACGTVSVKTTVVGKNLIESTDENGNKVYTLSMASIEGDTLTSAITFPEGVDAVYVVGGEDCEHPITVTFDTNLPEGKKIVPINHVDLKLTGNNLRELPMRQVELIAGSCVRLFAPVGEVDGVASLTIPAGATVKTEVNQEITLTSEGTFVVEAGATARVTASSAQAIKGTVTIAKGAKFINLTDDAIAYSANTGTTVEVYGDLNMGTNRWTIGGTSALNLYGGCTATGEGNGDSYGKGVFDIMRAGNTINVLTGEALADTVTIEGIVRIRDADGRINIAEGMKLALPGGLRGCNTANGKVTRVGNGHLTGTVTLIGGATTFLLDYQSITDAPADLRFVARPGESEDYRESKLKWKAAETDDMGDTADDPFVTITEGAQLSLEGDFKGANYLKNDGTLVFMAASRHFDKTMTLGDGALVKVNSTTSPLDFGGTITLEEEASASIVQGVDSDNHNARINFLEGATVNVGSGAKLTLTLPLAGAELTMNGTGKLALGENRHAVKVTENGALELTASAEEITEGRITLPIPEEGAVAERKLSVITDGGTPIDIAKTTSGEGVMIITLDTNTIVKDTNLSNVLKNGEESVGVILIRGGETHDKAVTLIFDRELPAGMSIRLSGHVTFYGLAVNSYPIDRIQIAAGSCLKIDKPFDKAYAIPAGNTLYMAVAPTQAITGTGTLVFDPGEGKTITVGANANFNGVTRLVSGTTTMGNMHAFGSGTGENKVIVDPGATLDTGAVISGTETDNYPIVLNGGTMTRSGIGQGTGKRLFWAMTLTADSTIDARNEFGAINHGHGAINFNLNGHKLTKIGSATYNIAKATFVGGGTFEVKEGTLNLFSTCVIAADTELTIVVGEKGALRLGDGFTVNGECTLGGEGSVTGFNLYSSEKPVTITATEKGALTFDSAINAQTIKLDLSEIPADSKVIPLFKVAAEDQLPETNKIEIPTAFANWKLERMPGEEVYGYRLMRPNFVFLMVGHDGEGTVDPLVTGTESFEAEAVTTNQWLLSSASIVRKPYEDGEASAGAGDWYWHASVESETEALTRTFTSRDNWINNDSRVVKMGTVVAEAMMKFPALDFEPELPTTARLGLWLKENGAEAPTMMVTCGRISESGYDTLSVPLKVAIAEDTWHKIKIESYSDSDPSYAFGVFMITIDGEMVAAAEDEIELIDPDYVEELLPNTRERDLYAARKLFPSLAEYSSPEAAELVGVGFLGSSDIDLISVTAATDSRTDYTLTLTYENPDSVKVWVNDGEPAASYKAGTKLTVEVVPVGNTEFAAASYEGWTKSGFGLKKTFDAINGNVAVTIPAPTPRIRAVTTLTIKVMPNTTLEALSINGEPINPTTTPAGAKQGDVIRLTFAADEGYILDGDSEMTVPLAYGIEALAVTISGPDAYQEGDNPPQTAPGGPKTATATFSLSIEMDGDEPIVKVEQNVVGGERGRMKMVAPRIVIQGSNDLKSWEPITDPANYKNYHFFKGVIEE